MSEKLEASSPVVSGELPCGYVTRVAGPDGDERAVVHRSFIVGEMTGEEEDLLAGKGPVVSRLNKVISNCTHQIGDVVSKQEIAKIVRELSAVDRMLMLIAVRRATLGDVFRVKVKCRDAECGETWRADVNLADLELVMMPEPGVRQMTDTVDGHEVAWHVMDGKDEEWLLGTQKASSDSKLTLAILARLDSLDGVKLDRDRQIGSAKRELKGLSMRTRNGLRELFTSKEGSIDTDVDFACPVCGLEFTSELEVNQPGFFFPQGT